MAHHHHIPSPSAGGSSRALLTALALIFTFMLVEVVAGILTGSLALLADAGHMLTDVAALALALFAARMAARPPRGAWTFGYKRTEILAALANGITLVVIGAFIVVEAVRRLSHPPEIEATWMLVVALSGIAVNTVATATLARSDRRSLNVEGAFRHIATDLAAFIGTAVAATVILTTGWMAADPVASLLVAGLIFAASWSLLRDSTRVLMEAAPAEVDIEEVGATMAAVDGVREVHDLHIWTVTSGFLALAAHVVCAPERNRDEVRHRTEVELRKRFDISHTTLQVVDQRPGPDLIGPEEIEKRPKSK